MEALKLGFDQSNAIDFTRTHGQLRRWFWGLVMLAAWLAGALGAEKEPEDPAILTLKRIYDSDDFNEDGFSGQWLENGSGYTTFESAEGKGASGGRDLVLHDPATDAKTILVRASDLVPPGRSSPLSVSGHTWSKDMSKLLIFTNTKRVWRSNTRGDYWVLDRSSHELRRLGADAPASSLMFAKFSPSGEQVAYVRDNNLYLEQLSSRQVVPLTTNGSATIINGTFDWVYEEELFLRDGFRWSPDGSRIALWEFDTAGVRNYPLVNNTDALYPEVQWIQYPKAGEMNAAGWIGVIDVNTGARRRLDVPGDPRQHYLHYLEWDDDSQGLLVQQFNRLQSTNHLFLADATTGRITSLLTERDDAWVDQQRDLHLEPGRKRLIWLSERDGWRHAYAVRKEDGKTTRITHGDYDVMAVAHWDDEKGTLYFMASPDNPTQRYLYKARLGKTKVERVTPSDQAGSHQYKISPDGLWAVHSWSAFDEPERTELISLPDHKQVRVLAENDKLKKRFAELKKGRIELQRVRIAPGVELDSWQLLPPDLDPAKKYPLLIYVYGEPAGQTVQDEWGGKSLLWHLMLTQHGYVVMSFDNRGTPAPRGRDWRKYVHRKVGILAPEDQAAAVKKVLEDNPFLDPDRVGVWGWSGGGSMTLNAILKYPDLYKTGIAVASVPNQRYYDTIYQERYMGLPKDNVDGYYNGSSVNFAHQLKGHLLLIHGTGDDNVHYQGAEALVNELIRNQKQFHMMAYPNRTHGISERPGTTMHLHQLMTDFLHDHLGGR